MLKFPRIDPDKKQAVALDVDQPIRVRARAAADLRDWCLRGGHPPLGSMDRYSTADAMRELLRDVLLPALQKELALQQILKDGE